MYQLLQYLKFIIGSKNAHGVHPPFLFKFLTECLYDNLNDQDYISIYKYREECFKDASILEIEDLGAGSKRFANNKRKVKSIVKHSASSLRQAKLLYRLAHYFKPASVLELGTSIGMGTNALFQGFPESEITSVEGSKSLSDFAKFKLKASNIHVKQLPFETYLNSLTDEHFDFIYIDGHHTKEATINYFNRLLKHTEDHTVMLFDDIYWSKGMTEAWEHIKSSPEVSLSVDTFFKGILFLRKGLSKENFRLRI